MKKISLFFLVIFITYISECLAKTVYLDVQFIIDNSDLGKYYKTKLLEKHNKTKSNLKTDKDLIKKKEQEINNQKNILKKEEIDKKIIELNTLLKKYQSNRNEYNKDINFDKKNYSNEILKILNPLLTQYVEDKSITLVMEKKNILVGIKTLDITEDILKILNIEVKKKNLINEN